VPRADSHLWFLLTGGLVPEMLAKLCGIDLRPHKFAPLAVAQTQAARISVIIACDDADLPAWDLLRIAPPGPTSGTTCWMRWPNGRADRSASPY
jgi:hypothetical protein